MKKFPILISLILIFSSCEIFVTPNSVGSIKETDIWVSAYFGAWNHHAPPGGNWGNLPTEEIDWDAFTHLFYFALTVDQNGNLAPIKEYETFSPSRIKSIVSAAHSHNTPVLFSVGGWGNYSGFSEAIKSDSREHFIRSIIMVMEKWGFDGVDIDMEPIKPHDEENYKAFITELHSQLQKRRTPLGLTPYLTTATNWSPNIFAELHTKFDQINLMTYDFSGAWEGWVSWHNSPVYSGGKTFLDSDRPLPSANSEVEKFLKAGVPKEKLGIGIDFYGYVWSGFVTGPLQNWTIPPTVQSNVPYHQIMKEYFEKENYQWDAEAKAAYLSKDHLIPLYKQFISYDDEKSIEAKINYVREKNIGGVIIWDLSGGYQKEAPKGKKDLLLQKVKKELHR
ncbi:MAG: glycoside hydrolase family 18 protein [Gracilimonas sp.]|uniref:glycoside hydrolase family 18 protein n=1 Tax=Gracilimonas sp. TaxID=1974203 RepID=UPI0019957FBF|nr:glycoside hydrolase family 18 protein [Gracilimonas sp.]MBD3615415.1 glycoside hydrolase family 18 protein [Gracilimonas sp.]